MTKVLKRYRATALKQRRATLVKTCGQLRNGSYEMAATKWQLRNGSCEMEAAAIILCKYGGCHALNH